MSRIAALACAVAVVISTAPAPATAARSGRGGHAFPGAVPDGRPPAAAASLIKEVSAARLRADVDRLAGFGTRHTLSDTVSETRGIGAARRWILDSFAAAAREHRPADLPPARIAFDAHTQEPDGRRITRPAEIVNVVAELPGARPEAAHRRIYVIGHYDSRASDPLDPESDAPGANDDGSGTALVMELFRVLCRKPHDATLVFMATAGEEQGLYGARLHAQAAAAAGDQIQAVLSNDIVGDPTGPAGRMHRDRIRVFSEGLPRGADEDERRRLLSLAGESDSPSRQLARFIAEVAAWHRSDVAPMLVFRADRFLRGGDHTAFNEIGVPAVRFTEVEENYDHQHQDVREENGVQYGDLPGYVDAAYLAGVARVNGAALVHVANAPSPPGDVRIVTAELGNDTELRWTASPEADVAGYEVVWRATTSPTWEASTDVGKVTARVLDRSKDNFYFGVRAYDADGYRSPVVFAGAARE